MGLKRGRSAGWSVLTLGLGFTIFMVIFSEAVPTDRLSKRFETKKEANNTFMRYEGCISDSKLYKDGEVVVDGAGPCEECICKPPEIQCTMIHCPVKTGCKIIQRSNQCCPQFQCDCEFNGKNYFNGEQIETQLDKPCEVCYCKGGEVMCTSVTCYERNDCLAKIIPGQCCPKYESCPPRKLNENGQPEKTDGKNGDDSKTKKREMQPWLLTNPAEETEKHETTEIYTPTAIVKGETPSQPIEEKTTTIISSGNDPQNNPSTEYASSGSITLQTFPPVSDEFGPFMKSTTNEVSIDSVSSETGESGTKQYYDIQGKDNSKSDSDDHETSTEDKISYFGSTVNQQATISDETTLKAIPDAETAGSTTILYIEPNVDKMKSSVENQIQEQEKHRTTETENTKTFEPTTDTDNSGTQETVTENQDTARLDVQEVATTISKLLGPKREFSSPTLEDSIEKDITTASGIVLIEHQEVGPSVIEMNTDEAESNYTKQEENTTLNISGDDSHHTTIKVDVEENKDVLSKNVPNGNKELQQAVTDFQTEATPTVFPGRESNKLIGATSSGKEKVTDDTAETSQDDEGKPEKEFLAASVTFDEGTSTVDYAQPITLRADINGSIDTNKDNLVMNASQEQIDADTKHDLFTTEVGSLAESADSGSATKISSNFHQETPLLSDGMSTILYLPYTTILGARNEETPGLLAETTMKTLNANEKLMETIELKDQTTEQELTEAIVSDDIKLSSSPNSPRDQISTAVYDATTARSIAKSDKTDENTEANGSDQEYFTTNDPKINERVKEKESQTQESTPPSEKTNTDYPLKSAILLDTTTNYSKNENVNQQFQQNDIETTSINTEENEEKVIKTTESLGYSFTTIRDVDPEVTDYFQNSRVTFYPSVSETNDGVQTLKAETVTKVLELAENNADLEVTQTYWDELKQNTNSPVTLLNAALSVENMKHPASLVNGETLTKISNPNQTAENQSFTPPKELNTSTNLSEGNKVTDTAELVESILQQAISMQSTNDTLTVIQPPKFIPIEYIAKNETSDAEEKYDSKEKPKGSTTTQNKKGAISTNNQNKIEETTEPLGDTQLVERLITKHVQNLTQIALASVANQLYDLVSKDNQTGLDTDSSQTKVQGEIILPKDSEIERIAEEIRNATIQSFQDSFETLEEKLLEDKFNITKTPKSTIHLTKLRIKPNSLRLRKIKGRRNKIKPKK